MGKSPARLNPTQQNPPGHFCIGGFVVSVFRNEGISVFRRPGSDLLFRVLRRSTIGAGVIYGRVRDGIGYGRPAKATRPAKDRVGRSEEEGANSE